MVTAIITDIEGTTTSVAFVYEVLFPYAKEHIPSYIKNHSQQIDVIEQLQLINIEVGKSLLINEAIEQLLQWMDEDKKVTPLKNLQGMIWEDGYKTNRFQGHVYDDVPANIKKWHDTGIPVSIYSSGSIKAQKLLFSHSIAGDLTPWLSGYFDTTIGAKKDHQSYLKIANEINKSPTEILFLSDITEELDAASQSGMQTVLLTRNKNDNSLQPGHIFAENFNQIQIN
jgi:enolase-phosphatase E1